MPVSLYLFLILNVFLVTVAQVLKMNFTIKEIETELISQNELLSFLELPPLPTQNKKSDRTYVNLCIGTPPQCFNVIIQTNTFSLWVQDSKNKNKAKEINKFERNKSSTLSVDLTQVGISIYNKPVIGYTGLDSLHIANVTVNRTRFVIATRPGIFNSIDGMIGLGYSPSVLEEEYSLIHQLYAKKIIPHRVYSLKYFNNNSGELSFGYIPQEIVSNYKKYGRCSALNKMIEGNPFKNKNWQCKLYSIIFGSSGSNDNSITFPNSKLTFMSYRKRTLLPWEKFEAVIDKYFGKKMIDNSCILNETISKKKIECNDLDGLGDIILDLGDWGMKLEKRQLFTEMNEQGKYEFVFYYKIGYEKFILGKRILSLFQMVYDGHNKEIGFFSSDDKVLLLSNLEPQPPKLHEDIQDKMPTPKPKTGKDQNEPKTDKKDKKPNQTDFNGDETEGERNVIRTKKTISSPFIIQIALIIFISLIVIGLLSYILYTYLRFRKKTRFNAQNYYIKQVNGLSSH